MLMLTSILMQGKTGGIISQLETRCALSIPSQMCSTLQKMAQRTLYTVACTDVALTAGRLAKTACQTNPICLPGSKCSSAGSQAPTYLPLRSGLRASGCTSTDMTRPSSSAAASMSLKYRWLQHMQDQSRTMRRCNDRLSTSWAPCWELQHHRHLSRAVEQQHTRCLST